MLARALVVLAMLASFGPALESQTLGGTLILRNARREGVRVELRMGASSDCTANAVVGTRTLRGHQAWTVVSTDVVCWRREVLPGAAVPTWTEWRGLRVAAGARQEVEL
jgi:hypothetical protein